VIKIVPPKVKLCAILLPVLILGACSAQLSKFSELLSTHTDSSEPVSFSADSRRDAVSDKYHEDPECFIAEGEYISLAPLTMPDLWDRIRDGFQLPSSEHKRIHQELNWYAKHPNYMNRVAVRGERYMFHIVEELERRNMPMEIALLPIVESAFDPFAYSHGRASGMWQIIPGTGKMLGLKQNWWYDGRRDVVASTDAALNYLESLHKRFDGNWLNAIAAYNSGGGNVSKAIRVNKRKGKPTDFWHLKLPKETMAYVPRLIALSRLVKDPADFALDLYSIDNAPYFQSVPIGSQIDLAQAASLAEVDMDVLYHLNPGFNRWATDPKGPHVLLVPVEKGVLFSKKMAAIPTDDRVTWNRYTIKQGDSLSTIAKKNNISVDSLKSINQLRGSRIRAGKTLMVPAATKPSQFYSYSSGQRLEKTHAAANKKEKGNQLDYIVQSGDSFWTISQRYKVSVQKLAKWNNMAPRDVIQPGQTLKIWTSTPIVVSASRGVIRKVSYHVRSGDSLHRIADKFSLTVSDILKWNQLKKYGYLQPGQAITLFVDVTKSREG
jgi:membrane-bound lytic murein transglycosylase D